MGSRADAQFCSDACRVASHRAVHLPFARQAGRFDHLLIASLAAENASPSDPVAAAMQRVEAAEKQLQAARREAKAAFINAGKDTAAMFSELSFVPRSSAKKWIKEAREEQAKLASPEPKLSWKERERRRLAYYAQPAAAAEPEDAEARERAVAARFNAATRRAASHDDQRGRREGRAPAKGEMKMKNGHVDPEPSTIWQHLAEHGSEPTSPETLALDADRREGRSRHRAREFSMNIRTMKNTGWHGALFSQHTGSRN